MKARRVISLIFIYLQKCLRILAISKKRLNQECLNSFFPEKILILTL